MALFSDCKPHKLDFIARVRQPVISAVPRPCELERVAAVGLPDPLIEIAVKSIRAYEAVNYKREVKSQKDVSNQEVGKIILRDEAEHIDNVDTRRVLSSYDVHLGIYSRLHG